MRQGHPTRSTVTRGGQITLPAEVRRRWGSQRVLMLDRGDHVVVRPVPADPVDALRGSATFEVPDGLSFADWWEREKLEQLDAEERRWTRRTS
jgi:AbrB family looped-hinge helix DNA binding protein